MSQRPVCCSCLTLALGVTKFMKMRDIILVTVVLLKFNLDVQQTHLRSAEPSICENPIVPKLTSNKVLKGNLFCKKAK